MINVRMNDCEACITCPDDYDIIARSNEYEVCLNNYNIAHLNDDDIIAR